SDQRFHNLGGMHLLLWRTIQEGKQIHARELDLGRTDADNHGLIAFKDRWGAAKCHLTYWRYPAQPVPATSTGWRMQMARKVFSRIPDNLPSAFASRRSEEHTSELQSRRELVCRPLLEKK